MDVAGEELGVVLDTEDNGVAARWTLLVSGSSTRGWSASSCRSSMSCAAARPLEE
jgi:hypothetical protein